MYVTHANGGGCGGRFLPKEQAACEASDAGFTVAMIQRVVVPELKRQQLARCQQRGIPYPPARRPRLLVVVDATDYYCVRLQWPLPKPIPAELSAPSSAAVAAVDAADDEADVSDDKVLLAASRSYSLDQQLVDRYIMGQLSEATVSWWSGLYLHNY